MFQYPFSGRTCLGFRTPCQIASRIAEFRHYAHLTCLSLLLFLNSTSALPQESVVWLPYPEDGVTLGQGFDLLSNRKTPSVCVDFVPVEDAGLETASHLSTLNSFHEVFSSMSITASGALDMSTFLTASARLGLCQQD